MLKKVFTVGGNGVVNSWRMITNRHCTTTSSSVNSILLSSLKEHYLEVTKMNPPPKVSPPSSFTIVKGAIECNGAVLRKTHGNEEITINFMHPGEDDDGDDQFFVHVDVSKPGKEDSIHFLCRIYSDSIGVLSVSIKPKIEASQFHDVPFKYTGPAFQDLDVGMRDALHRYIEVRGVSERLFPFVHAWLYLKYQRTTKHWFKTIETFITEPKSD